jgi:tetratricopeptide (TPR) repeat protein
MKHLILLTLATFLLTISNAQKLVSNREQIEKAKKELESSMSLFSTSIVNKDLDTCIETLIKSADNGYKKYIVGGLLFEIDADKSFQLHKEAFQSNSADKNFVFEYAIELHRQGKYKEAAELYEKYLEVETDDYRIYVWLADCYINLGETKKAIDNWTKANHPKNHTGIDFAIHIIYGNTSQLKQRNKLRSQIFKGNSSKLFDLIFLDQNWEMDWWNKKAQENFLDEDLELARKKLSETNSDYKLLKAYTDIKKKETQEGKVNEIKAILIASNLILNNKSLPQFGQITSDLIRISFMNQFINETEFYQKRGNEVLELSKQTKDKDLLNIYAYLQATVNGTVKPEIDKLGWTDFKDERFAISYFLGKASKNRFDDPELQLALLDFPNSSKLHWVKLNCAKIEHKQLKPIIIEVIKREFKTLGSDEEKSSYNLKNYFSYLQTEE